MEEILNKIDELNTFLTEENLAKMSADERARYLNLVEKLKARVDVLIKIGEGGIK